MSPAASGTPSRAAYFPRVSGEERYWPTGVQDHDVFPARARMSPWFRSIGRCARRFPRVSGDEPAALQGAQAAIEFSPRERG